VLGCGCWWVGGVGGWGEGWVSGWGETGMVVCLGLCPC
jgi:hypothetical protein